MTAITAALVKELRERTGAGMMECKKALVSTSGDIDAAVEELRKSGAAKADKKAGRTAAEGAIIVAGNSTLKLILEVNSETDFVARDENFLAYAKAVAATALAAKETNVEALAALPIEGGNGKTVEEARQELVQKVGENVQLRRLVLTDESAASVGDYIHGGRIGVLVELDVDNEELARDIAMHIAASNPIVVAPEDVPEDVVAKEKEIFMAQAAESGKPKEIIEKMITGRMKKYLDEVSLVGQPFVKDPDMKVGALLSKNNAKVLGFYRYEVGEGIEKASEDFAEEVMKQVASK